MYLNQAIHQQQQPRIVRVLLAVFVLAWLNLIVQSPLHATMKLSMQMDGDMPCQCDEWLCDTVLAMQDQAGNGTMAATPALPALAIIFVRNPVLPPPALVVHNNRFRHFQLHETSPPLAITGILRI